MAATLIADGMVYVGPDLPPIGGWQDHEPALIDPTLNVSRGRIDQASENLGYWPSYGRISPESRAAYLEWLAGGRCDPDADIGYVFLFFYGLERRLLFDLRHLPERRSEAPSLIAEVARLRSLYGANGSFASYSSSLLQIAQSLWSDGRACERPPSFDRPGSELPADVRLAVGQLVAAGEPIPADWALAWVTGHPETRLRTPARRCPEEFRHLFCHRYREKFGQGMLLKPNKRRLKISHRPASASFGDEVEVPFEHIPDIAALKVPIRPLQEIAEAAMSELDAYSRLVGRSPEKARTLEGRALLPPELAEVRKSPASERLQRWVEASLGDGDGAAVPASDLMAHWDCARADRMSKRELGSFARALESLGFGIEPDPRFGGGSIREGQKVVLFPLGSERIAAASPAYRASTLLLHLAALVAASDGSVGDAEERHLEEQLERSMSLDPDEVRRLRAHLMWLLVEQPSAAGIKSRLEGVDSASRRLLAEFAMATAAADGVIDRGEIRTLTKIYGLLGFDPDQAYGDVHSLQVSDSWRPAEGPLRVRPQVVGPSGRAIPEPPSAESVPPSGFKLDMDRVQRTLAETVAISQVLAEVFEDEPAEAGRGELAPVTSNTVAGLDARHAALLLALDGRSELSSAEFEELAESFDLLADGAREMLNEAAFERADNALLEGEDPVEVNLDVLSELQT
ncbi:MAG: hypothetical protein GY725_08915 [bacterium]|nr:hypothetical protein [bacterium]